MRRDDFSRRMMRETVVTADDLMGQSAAMISVFIREPEFQGQNKSRLMTVEASRIVESAVRDAFDHWLAGAPSQANKLLDFAIERAEAGLLLPAGGIMAPQRLEGWTWATA